MIQNILNVLVGASLGALILGVVEANIRIKYIHKIAELKIENTKILSKNQKLFEDNQDLEHQVDILQEYIMSSMDDGCIDCYRDC